MKIIIVQTGRIGDTILVTPMFRAVKQQFPDTEIHVLTSPKGLPIVARNPHLSKVIVHSKGIFGLLSTIFAVRKEHYDVWIDPKDHRSSESSLLAKYSGARKRIGFNPEGSHTFTESIPSDKENFLIHAIERNLRSLASLGYVINNNARPELFIPSDIEEQITTMFSGGKKIVVVNISAGQPSRLWNDEGWSSVIEHCFKKGHTVTLTFQPSDLERAVKFRQRFSDLIIVHSPTIDYAIALVKHALLLITVDTSIVHIASAFNIPIVGLYPDVVWNYNKFKPLSEKQSVIFSSSPTSLLDISAETVCSTIDNLIEN